MNLNTENLSEEVVGILEKLDDYFSDQDPFGALECVRELKEISLTDAEYIRWITTPYNLSQLHKRLVEELEIPPKILMLRFRIPNRRKQAYMIMETIDKALIKVHGDV